MNPVTRIARAVLATWFALVSVLPAQADQFWFRYAKNGPIRQSAEVAVPGDYDITARFVGMVGLPFSSKVPVKPGAHVVAWEVTEGVLPEGLSLDIESGTISGVPAEATESRKLKAVGFAPSGKMGSKADVAIDILEPQANSFEQDYYARTGKPFQHLVKGASGTVVDRWEPVLPLPEWASLLNSSLQGTPPEAGSYGVALAGFDFDGNQVAFTLGSLLVEDGPGVGFVADVIQDKELPFNVNPVAGKALGPLRWELSGDPLLPGLAFDFRTGRITGTALAGDLSGEYRIRVTDVDGTFAVTNPFVLGTLPPDLAIGSIPAIGMLVNRASAYEVVAQDAEGPQEWTLVAGELPPGVALSASTGRISGTPIAAGTWEGLRIQVVSDTGTVTSNLFSIRVHPDELEAGNAEVHVRSGDAFATPELTAKGGTGPYTFELSPDTALPDGILLAAETGSVSGVATAERGRASYIVHPVDSTGRKGKPSLVAIHTYSMPEATIEPLHWGVRLSMLSPSIKPELAPYSTMSGVAWSLEGGALPPGLALNAGAGTIQGTPTLVGSFGPYTMTVTDGTGAAGSTEAFTIRIEDLPDIVVTVEDVEVERALDAAMRLAMAANTVGSVSYALDEDSAPLPAGLDLDAEGILRGSTFESGEHHGIVVRATDSEGRTSVSAPFAIRLVNPAPLQTSLEPFTWPAGYAFTTPQPSLTKAYGETAFAADAPLPDWLSIDPSTGAFSGTAPEPGEYGPFPFSATDGLGRTASGETFLSATPPMASLLPPEITVARLEKLDPPLKATVTNGVGKLSWSMSGAVPDGMTFDASSGTVSGTPTKEGRFTLSLTAVDAAGQIASASTAIAVGPRKALEAAYSMPRLEAGSGKGLPALPKARNASGAVQWSFSGDLPEGVVFEPTTGAFSGVPAVAGEWTVTVSAVDEDGSRASTQVQIAVDAKDAEGEDAFALSYGSAALTAGSSDGLPLAPAVTNGSDPVAFTASQVPSGLLFDTATGAFSGTPDEPGEWNVTVSAADAKGNTASAEIRFTVSPAGDMTVAASVERSVRRGEAFATKKVDVQGAVQPLVFSDRAGGLGTDGLTLDPATGAVSGVMNVETTKSYPLSVTDAAGRTRDFTLTISAVGTLSVTFADVTVSQHDPVSGSARLANKAGDATFAISGPALPTGVTLNAATGALEGTADAAPGSYGPFTVTATDASQTASAQFSITVEAREELSLAHPDIVANQHSPIGAEAVPTVTNASGTVTWTLTGPALPPGLAFSETTGRVTGTPTQTGSFGPFTLKAADRFGSADASFSIAVNPRKPLAAWFVEQQNDALANREYSLTPMHRDAVGAVTWQLHAGTLPPGLSLDAAGGQIEGTPTGLGTWSGIVLRATDAAGGTVTTAPISITVVLDGEPIDISTTPLDAKVGIPFATQPPQVVNEVGDYIFMAPQAADLGLAFDELTGVISGVFSTPGTRNIDVSATDMTNRVTSEPQVIRVLPALRITMPTPIYGMVNVDMPSITPVTDYAATGPVAYSLSGPLPAGMTFNPSTGTMSGKPTQMGVFPLTVTGEDSLGDRQPSNPFTIEIVDDGSIPLVRMPTVPVYRAGQAIPQLRPTVTYKKTGDVYSLNKDLPDGLTLDPATGYITGTPSQGTHGLHQGYVMSVRDVSGRGTQSDPFDFRIRHHEDPSFSVPAKQVRSNIDFVTAPVTVTGAHAVIGTLRYEIVANGSGLSINASTGAISGKIPSSRSVTLRALDDFGALGANFPVSIQVVALTATFADAAFAEGSQVDIAATVNGVMGPGESFALSSQTVFPQGISIDASTGRITGTMPFGTYFMRLSVSDNGATAHGPSATTWAKWRGTSTANLTNFESLVEQDHGAVVESSIIPITRMTVPGAGGASAVSGGAPDYRVCYDAACSHVRINWRKDSVNVENGEFVQMRAHAPVGSLETFSFRFTTPGGNADWSVTSKARDDVVNANSVLPVSVTDSGGALDNWQRLYDNDTAEVSNLTDTSMVTYDFGRLVSFDRYYLSKRNTSNGYTKYTYLEIETPSGWARVHETEAMSGTLNLNRSYTARRIRLAGNRNEGHRLSEFRIGNGGGHGVPSFSGGDKFTLAAGQSTVQITAATKTSAYIQANSATYSVVGGSLPPGSSLSASGELSLPAAANPGNWAFTVRATDQLGFRAEMTFYAFAVGPAAETRFPVGGASLPVRQRLYNGSTSSSDLVSSSTVEYDFGEYVTFSRVAYAQLTNNVRSLDVEVMVGGTWVKAGTLNTASGNGLNLNSTYTAQRVRVTTGTTHTMSLTEFRIGTNPPVYTVPVFASDGMFFELGAEPRTIQLAATASSYAIELRFARNGGTVPAGTTLSADGILTLPAAPSSGTWRMPVDISDGTGAVTQGAVYFGSATASAADTYPSSARTGTTNVLPILYGGGSTARSVANGTNFSIDFTDTVRADSVEFRTTDGTPKTVTVSATIGGTSIAIGSGTVNANGTLRLALSNPGNPGAPVVARQFSVTFSGGGTLNLNGLKFGMGTTFPPPL